LFQDNQAALHLEVNGRLSFTKRIKHIHARYFLIKDHIDRGEIERRHYPTEKMWIDMDTKPTQGKGFRLNGSHLQNVPVDYGDDAKRRRTNPALLVFDKNPREPPSSDSLKPKQPQEYAERHP
ncbi:hypothetical protein ACHAWF_003799, partial [Thalassiosira exigua]